MRLCQTIHFPRWAQLSLGQLKGRPPGRHRVWNAKPMANQKLTHIHSSALPTADIIYMSSNLINNYNAPSRGQCLSRWYRFGRGNRTSINPFQVICLLPLTPCPSLAFMGDHAKMSSNKETVHHQRNGGSLSVTKETEYHQGNWARRHRMIWIRCMSQTDHTELAA